MAIDSAHNQLLPLRTPLDSVHCPAVECPDLVPYAPLVAEESFLRYALHTLTLFACSPVRVLLLVGTTAAVAAAVEPVVVAAVVVDGGAAAAVRLKDRQPAAAVEPAPGPGQP